MALAFRDSAALEVAIRSGLVSREAAAGPAKVARGSEDAIVLEPDKHLPSAVAAKLRAAGVHVDAALPGRARAVRCWAEALGPVRVAATKELPALVLFETERAADLIDVAAELVRLGCDRQELLVTGDRGVIRVVDPPTYTIVRALDRDRGLRVYAPDPAKQDRVWTELGFHHPLAEHLRAEPGSLLLCAGDGWRSVADQGWLGVDAALELAVPGRATPHVAGALPARRRIELHLSQGRRDVPSMWVIRDDAVAKIDQLLAYLPDDVVERLMFAVTAGSPPTVIVRARTGRHAAPDLALVAEEYAPLGGMPDVYAPVGAIVEPPLRRERLRGILGVEAREVLWLARIGTAFRVERISDPAFAPLSEWADYVLHANAPALEPWLRAAEIDFTPFVSSGLEWANNPGDDKSDKPDAKRKSRGAKQASVAATVEAPAPTPRPQAPKPPPPPKPQAPVAQTQVEIDAELAQREAEFIALDAPGDAPERIALLDRLGRIYARLSRLRDAGLCFARAVWEAGPGEADARLDVWLAAHLGNAQAQKLLDRALAQNIPDNNDVRLVAVLAARGAPGVAADPHRVTRWLDDHDGELDARTLWLARLGLAQLAGGDPLLLAHARDRILARLAGGLPVERELPAFLRLAGRSGALGNASGDHLGTALDELVSRIEKTRRKRTPLEAPPHLTNAYVSFQLGYGYARIGRASRARELVAAARKLLDVHISDPVHAYLASAFAARVDQAIAGMAPETALPDDLVAQLAALDRNQRYKTDRLRERSRILAPLDRPQAISGFTSWEKLKGTRGPEFAALAKLADPVKRAKAVDELVTKATAGAEDRERLLEGVLDVLLDLPESGAVPILHHAWQVIGSVTDKRQAPLYARALVVAGHFGRAELVPPLLDKLRGALRIVEAAELEQVLQYSLRALRRIGLRSETAELLVAAEEARTGTQLQVLRGRLAIAGGLSYLGEFSRAKPIFEQSHAALSGTTITAVERLDLVRAIALAYAQAPLQQALAGIAELSGLFKDISDVQSTNSHYCLSVLDFVESLVLGITSDDLALGEAGRRFVEDDEHLIRRRLHRDLGGPA